MLHRKITYQSAVYRDFETLDKRNYHEIVRFCERNRTAIDQLNFEEFFIMELCYCNALFQMDYHERHIETAIKVIELSILNNIQFYQGEDIYRKTLFQKAQAHRHLGDLPQAIHITKELLKMNATSKPYQKFLKLCYTNHNAVWLQQLRGYGVLISLISATFFLLNILIIEPFYPNKSNLVNLVSAIGLVIGGLMLGGGLTFHHLKARLSFNQFFKTLADKKTIQK